MRLLVIHQNFPGQFGHLVRAWSTRRDWSIQAIGRNTAPGIAGFESLTRYELARPPQRNQHPYLRSMESAVLHGQAVARLLLTLKQRGEAPDVVLAHPGWGETLYVKDVFPETRLIHYCEWYYTSHGADVGFDAEFPSTFDDLARIRTWNALHLLNLELCDRGVTPTRWQHSRHPTAFRDRIEIIHEGIDSEGLGPDPQAWWRTPNGTVLKAGDPVVTYVARNLEPYRGFHVFMRALERLQAACPNCHAVIVGGDDVSYGSRAPNGRTWREHMLQEVRLDPARTHFVGKLPRRDYERVLQVGAAHVYLTYPFVLSWSLLEAMACGCRVIASDTPPVREVIRDGVQGRLVDFGDFEALTHAMQSAMNDPLGDSSQRAAARTVAVRYGTGHALGPYERLMGAALTGRTDPPATCQVARTD